MEIDKGQIILHLYNTFSIGKSLRHLNQNENKIHQKLIRLIDDLEPDFEYESDEDIEITDAEIGNSNFDDFVLQHLVII